MDTTASETTMFRLQAQMDHSGGKKSPELASHFVLLEYNWYQFRSTHAALQPTLFMVKLAIVLTQTSLYCKVGENVTL